jgi:uncharacterized protein (TIGR03067 family)
MPASSEKYGRFSWRGDKAARIESADTGKRSSRCEFWKALHVAAQIEFVQVVFPFSWSLIMKYFSLGGALLVTALATSGWCAEPEKTSSESKALNGVWVPVSAVLDGKSMTTEECKGIHAIFHNGKYSVQVGKQTDKGTYTIDESKDPKQVTIVGTDGPNKGKTIPGIFERDKDTLKVCYDMSGKAAPEKFESKADSKAFLVTYAKQEMKSGSKRIRKVLDK